MLHLVHLLERRIGTDRASAIVLRLLLAFALLLMLGLGLLLSGRAAAQEAVKIGGSAIATRLLEHLDAGEFADAEAMFSAQMAAAVPAKDMAAIRPAALNSALRRFNFISNILLLLSCAGSTPLLTGKDWHELHIKST